MIRVRVIAEGGRDMCNSRKQIWGSRIFCVQRRNKFPRFIFQIMGYLKSVEDDLRGAGDSFCYGDDKSAEWWNLQLRGTRANFDTSGIARVILADIQL